MIIFFEGGGGQGGPKIHVQVFMKIVGVQRNRCWDGWHFSLNWFMKDWPESWEVLDSNCVKKIYICTLIYFISLLFDMFLYSILWVNFFTSLRWIAKSFHGATMSGGCLRLRSRLRQLAWKLVRFEEGVVGFSVGLLTEGTIKCWYMGVSKNRRTPKSSILIGFSIINHPFWGIPIFGNTHMLILKTFKSSNIWKAFRNTKNWNIPFIFCVFFNQRWSHD